MTDRELLELAAKAAGIYLEEGEGEFMFWDFSCDPAVLREWNPLTDDGDALRLAVKLELIVDPHGMHSRVSFPFGDALSHEPHNNDPYEATRLAIVRAAAEIGKESK